MRPSGLLRRATRQSFASDPKSPIEELLKNSLGYRANYLPRDSRDPRNPARNDVVSEQLCDDIIGYLAPTLEQHKGCTLIDANPGACLWSSKIHDFLKPRRHILMEPDRRYLQPFIKPLLDKPESTYRHTTLRGIDDYDYADNWEKMFADPELFPQRSPLIEGDPQLRRLDPGLLLTGNLVRQARARKGFNYGAKFATLIARQMAAAALGNSHAHKYGLVRMLWWIPELEKASMIAYWESMKNSLNTGLNMGTSVTEVVGCSPLRNAWKAASSIRPPFMEEAAEARVQGAMEQLGIRLPEGRQANINEKLPSSVRDVKFVSPLQPSTDTFKSLKDDIATTRARLDRIMAWPTSRKKMMPAADLKWALQTITFPQCMPCATYHNENSSKRGTPERLAVFLDLCMLVVRHEATFRALTENRNRNSSNELREWVAKSKATIMALAETLGRGDKFEGLEDRISTLRKELQESGAFAIDTIDVEGLVELEHSIRSLDKDLWATIDLRGHQWSRLILDSLNEQVSFFSDPPVLPRDGRLYEPFKAKQDEFWPATEFALIDMTPVERDLAVPGLASGSDTARVCQEMVKYLFAARRLSIPAALDRMAPNAAQDLIPMSPSITDARKGGRMNPQRLSVSMLTEEMIVELVKAFIEWPFKPDLVQLTQDFESARGTKKAGEDDQEIDPDSEDM